VLLGENLNYKLPDQSYKLIGGKMSADFRQLESCAYSSTGHLYQKLIDKRNNDINETQTIITTELLLLPLIVLGVVETVARIGLYILLMPASVVVFICDDECESIPQGLIQGVVSPLVLSGLQVSFLAASIKGLYRNILSEPLPVVESLGKLASNKEQRIGAAINFMVNELTCGLVKTFPSD
jgi:hypothetical protein